MKYAGIMETIFALLNRSICSLDWNNHDVIALLRT